MKNLKQLCLFLSAGTIAALSISACGDDTPVPGGTAGTGTTAGTSTAGTATAGTTSAGTSAGGTASAGTSAGGTATAGTASGGASAGTGGASGGTGGASAGAAGKGGGGGTGGASGGSGGSGGGGADLACTKAGDPGLGETCTTYCNNYDTTCKADVAGGATPWVNNKYTDKAACMTDCMNKFGYTGDDVQSAICCRGYHVKNAAGSDANKQMHCPHAAGKALCK